MVMETIFEKEKGMKEFSLIKLLLEKPMIAGIFGGTVTILTLLHLVAAGIGLLTVIVLLIASIYSLIHKRKQVIEDDLRIEKLRQELKD
jgi:O-antigen/teichoic acid export membrane protein